VVLIGAIDTAVVVALISAGVSLVVAVLAQLGNRRTSIRLAELEEERAERSARRDYEYEARKRLYEECEPLLFQAVELATTARSRVLSLARTARNGDLGPDGSGWLSGPGYYFKSTAYQLFAPVSIFRLLQQRLTGVDLSLDQRLRTQYEVLKLLFLSFNADFDLARCAPVLPYEPDKTDPDERGRETLLAADPARYARQGLYRGILDVVVESMIVDGRSLTFGEFLRAWDQRGSALHGSRGELLYLLAEFHPARKPVLWRVLIAQHLLYTALLRDEPIDAPLSSSLEDLDWRPAGDAHDDDAVREPVRAAEDYVRKRLAEVAARLPATADGTSR
jgi:hypothetical protein